jgi:hypothetical protein
MRLTVGKTQLCEIRQQDLDNESVINRIDNKTSSSFLSLYDIFQTQWDLRQLNITRKKQRMKQTSEVSLGVIESTQVSLSMDFLVVTDCRIL